MDDEQREIWRRLSERVQSFCAPIWWEKDRQKVLGNGTMTLVRTASSLFGVTNDLGGISGGPCVRLVPEKNSIELAGFVCEAGQDSEIIRVRQASLITADGAIAAPPIDWRPPPRRPRR